jgi:RNA polymerase sigma-70 factor (ECF subfamily)
MTEVPTTHPSLLLRLRDGHDQDAWREFVRLYAPVVYGYARRHGMQDADAADVTQDVLRSVAAGARRLDYDPRRGTFRGWLFTLAHHRLYDLHARRRRHCPGSGDSAVQDLLDGQPDRADDRAAWDLEYERQMFTRAAEQVRGHFTDTTWRAFWLTAVEGRSGRDVAAELGMTVAAVYLAKSRVMARLREQIQEFEGD